MKIHTIFMLFYITPLVAHYGRVEKVPDLSYNMKHIMNERIGGSADERVVKQAEQNPDRHFEKDDFVIIKDTHGEYRHMKVVDAPYIMVTDEKTMGIIKENQIIGKARPLFISQEERVQVTLKCDEIIAVLSHISQASHKKTFNTIQETLKNPWLTWKDLDMIVKDLQEIKNHRSIQKKIYRKFVHGTHTQEETLKYWMDNVIDPSLCYITAVRDTMHA